MDFLRVCVGDGGSIRQHEPLLRDRTLIMGRVKGYVDLLADSRYVIYSLIYSVYMVIH